MTLKIKGIEEIMSIIPGESIQLVIENSNLFYSISKDLISLDEDDVILYENKILSNAKYILIITDLLNLDPNTKKILTSNYKYVENITKNTKLVNKLIELNTNILEIIGEISENFNNSVTYNNQITVTELLEIYNFKFEFDDLNFVDTFTSYVKAMSLAINYKIIVTYDIQNYISNDEFQLLNKDLGYLGITLINLCSIKSNLTYKTTILIDNDLCEF